jgi:hypothetical protein
MARSVAGRLREIVEEVDSASAAADEYSTDSAAANSGRPARPTSARAAERKRAPKTYPKFYVEHGVLYKVGWSKKEKQEYVHKIPRDAFEITVRAIAELARNDKKPFTSEEVGQTLDGQGHSVPIYQVYLTLALLRERDVIERKGRDGYRANSDVLRRALQLWSEL